MAYAYTCDICKTSFIIEDLTNIQEDKNVEHCPFCYRGTKRHLHFSGATENEESRYKITLKDSNNLKVGESIMVNNNVKNLSGYGTGWAFQGDNTGEIDLSKFAINKGYSAYVQHFGIEDPLIGNEGNGYWYTYSDVVKYVLKATNVVDEWLNYVNSRRLDGDAKFNNFEDAVNWVVNDVHNYELISDFLVNKNKIISENCVFGVLDKDYFEELIRKSFSDDEAYYEYVDSDMLTFDYK